MVKLNEFRMDLISYIKDNLTLINPLAHAVVPSNGEKYTGLYMC